MYSVQSDSHDLEKVPQQQQEHDQAGSEANQQKDQDPPQFITEQRAAEAIEHMRSQIC